MPPVSASASSAALGQWRRAVLVYHSGGRTAAQWQRHLMRVDADGRFTGQWLFDGAILTAQSYNGRDLMYGGFSGEELDGLLGQLFADAFQLDAAATALAARFGAPNAPHGVVIGVPWLSPATRTLTLPDASQPLDLSAPDQRVRAMDWYLEQIASRAAEADWKHLRLYGAYYHREEIIDAYDDPAFVASFNAGAHARGMKTVWVPYYGAPHMWDATELGFDVSNVQPSVAFRGHQYGGQAGNGRLYALGQDSKAHSQAYEYETSTAGQTQPENWLSHQYLAVARHCGIDVFPQVFYTGTSDDMFDTVTTQAAAIGDRWWCYNDLADYLAGRPISRASIRSPGLRP